ncbi:hypothetical protein ACVANZ_003537, partial [Vibrio cholerae]
SIEPLSIQRPKAYERSLKTNFYGLGVILFSMDVAVNYCIYFIIYLIALGLRAILSIKAQVQERAERDT